MGPAAQIQRTGLVLTGGGARGAYQAGVLSALGEIMRDNDIPNPFSIITGNSAGSINAAYMAANIDQFDMAANTIRSMWESIHTEQIFHVDSLSLFRIVSRWGFELISGKLSGKKKARGLLQTDPLYKLIQTHIPFEKIQKQIDAGNLHSLGITAVNYSTGTSKTFFQGHSEIQSWHRTRRRAESTQIQAEHVMASTALPILFPPVKIKDRYYGDGSLRNYTPLSPAIKLGASKLFVIAVRQPEKDPHDLDVIKQAQTKPTLARVLGVVFNTVLLDAIDFDYERISRINHTLSGLSDQAHTQLKPIDVLMVRPSEDLGQIAAEEFRAMPATLSHLIQGLGTNTEAADLISYLLFERAYATRLIRLGYKDAYYRKAEILSFLAAA